MEVTKPGRQNIPTSSTVKGASDGEGEGCKEAVKTDALDGCQACDGISCAGHSSKALECVSAQDHGWTHRGSKAFHVRDTGFQSWLFSASVKFKSRCLSHGVRMETRCAEHVARAWHPAFNSARMPSAVGTVALVLGVILAEIAAANVEAGAFGGFSSYFKYGYFQKPKGFEIQQKGSK